jgi:hypothetical protein
MLVGDFSSRMSAGSVPVHPGPVMAKIPAFVPVVRAPGVAKTFVQASSIGRR